MSERKPLKRKIESDSSESEDDTIVVSSDEDERDSSIFTDEYTDEEVEEGRSFEVPENLPRGPIRNRITQMQSDHIRQYRYLRHQQYLRQEEYRRQQEFRRQHDRPPRIRLNLLKSSFPYNAYKCTKGKYILKNLLIEKREKINKTF